MDELNMVMNSDMDNDEGGLWLALSQVVGGIQSAGPPSPDPTSRLQATVRNVLAHFSDYEATDPCVRAECKHPHSTHDSIGCCLVVTQQNAGWSTDCACDKYITDDDVELERLAADLSAIVSEDEDGHGWSGSAAELASKVRRLIEQER